MPTRLKTPFVSKFHSNNLLNSPSFSSKTDMPTFKAALQTMVAHADAAAALLTTAAGALNSGPQAPANLQVLNEAASDLGYLDDNLRTVAQTVSADNMADWAKPLQAAQKAIAQSFVLARAAGGLLLALNPTFEVAQLP